MERRNLVIGIVLAVIIAGAGIGAYVYQPSGSGTLVYDTIGQAEYLDPAICYETAGGEVIENTYEKLVGYDGTSATELVGVLAQSWTESTDGLTYTFNLRQGIKFEDGTDFNAYAMKWSLDRIILINDVESATVLLAQCIVGAWDYITSPAWEGSRAELYQAAKTYLDAGGVEVVSEYVLRIHVDYCGQGKPYKPFILILAGTWASAVSPSYVLAHGGSQADDPSTTNDELMSVPNYFDIAPTLLNGMGIVPGARNEWMLTHTCGTGPYVVSEYTPATRIVLTRNEFYWGGPESKGLAQIKRIIINEVDDYNTRKANFLAGDSDFTYVPAAFRGDFMNLGTRAILPAYADKFVIHVDEPTMILDQINLNMNATLERTVCTAINGTPVNAGDANRDLNPLQFLKFRLAMQYSFNHTNYINALNGFGIEPDGCILQGMFGYNPSIPKYPMNVTKAAQLFSEVGWEGTIEEYYNTGNYARQQASLQLKDAVGNATAGKVVINVNSMTWSQILPLMYAYKTPIFIIGWMADFADADNFIMTYGHSTGSYAKVISFSNATLDDQLETAATTTDPSTRQALYDDAQMTLYNSACYIWLAQGLGFSIHSARVHGYYYNPIYPGAPLTCRFYDLWLS